MPDAMAVDFFLVMAGIAVVMAGIAVLVLAISSMARNLSR